MRRFFKYVFVKGDMKKGVLFLGLLVLVVVSVIIILPKINLTGFAIFSEDLSEDYLEGLRLKAKVECLQNSQCSEGFECSGNKCVDEEEINLCQDFKLYSGGTKLEVGQPINSVKSVITHGQLPYLLSPGEIVEVVNEGLIEYIYLQIIFIGENKIEKENEDCFIKKNNEPFYTYKLVFSKAVDFSSENIQGQVLRILGEEYVIGSKSDNSKIYLISDNKEIKLEDGGDIKITRNEEGNVIMFEIGFNPQNNLKVKEDFSDSTFNAIKLSFDNFNGGFADVRLGGSC